jgi:hypothetical protein
MSRWTATLWSTGTRNRRLHWLRADPASLGEVRDLDGRSVTANCLHPATYMPTKIVRDDGAEPVSSLDEGIRATLRLIADPELDGVTGRYFDGTAEADPHPQARDAAGRRRLRDLSDRPCGLAPAARDPSAFVAKDLSG